MTAHAITQAPPKGWNGTYRIPIGFERLRDGQTVAKLISDMQKDTT